MLEGQIERLTKLIMTIETYAIEETFNFALLVIVGLWSMIACYMCLYWATKNDAGFGIITFTWFFVCVFLLYPILVLFTTLLDIDLLEVHD